MTPTNAIVPTALANEISENVERKLSSLRESIESYQRYIANKVEDMKKVEAQFIEVFAVKARLEAAGFKPAYSWWTEGLRLDIDQKQLTAAYEVLGRFDGRGAEKDIVDSRKRLVKVTLTSVKHPFVAVSYVTKLPKRGAKCRIETVRVKARTEKRLVCER